MKKNLLLFLFIFTVSVCFAGPLSNLATNRYRGNINANGVNYELYIVNSDTTMVCSYTIHAKITDKKGNVTWITGTGNGSNTVKTLRLNKLNRWGIFENQTAEADHDGFDLSFLTKNLNKGSNADVLKALNITSEEIDIISVKDSLYEVQTAYGPLQLKLLSKLEK